MSWRWPAPAAAVVALVLVTAGLAAAAGEPVLVDDFETPGGWTVSASPGSKAELTWEREPDGGSALRMDYGLANASGFVILRKTVNLDLPENFAFTFRLRGEAPRSTVEFKLVDPDGKNVWWRRQREFSFPPDWQTVTVRKSWLAFAWGPNPDEEPRRIGAIEIAVSGGERGPGTIWIDDLRLEPREPLIADGTPPMVDASSARPGFEPQLALDGSQRTRWHSDAAPTSQWLLLDFGHNREYGGLAIDWDPADYATMYTIEVSQDGDTWTQAYHTDTGKGGRDYVYMPEVESRYLRLDLERSSRGRGYGIVEIDVKPTPFSESPNAFFSHISYDAPPGTYPKYFSGKQTYWTVVGVDGDGQEALVNEEGMVEVDRAYSLEPFLWLDGKLITWADAEIGQELAEGDLPIPTVTWKKGGLRLRVTAVAAGPAGGSTLYLRYRIENASGRQQAPRLFLAVRPFQVSPPWQSLNIQGGVTQIRDLRWDGRAVWVDRTRAVVPMTPPDSVGAATFEDGPLPQILQALGRPPEDREVTDPFGFASAALGWRLSIAAGGAAEVGVAVPLHETAASGLPAADPALVGIREAEARARWTRLLDRVEVSLPPAAGALARTWRSTVAYILVNQAGPALRPGPRNYARSWIRDGAMESVALLQTGFAPEVRDFLRWYATQQRADGAIPCCVDRRGPDWTPEHDSEGAFIFALAEYYRYTRDVGFVQDLWPQVVRAVDRIAALRAQRTTREYSTADRRAFYGLMPESISHEGYSGHPVHSYWDDFFALRGLKDAATLAVVVGDDHHADRFAELRDAFRVSLLASLDATMTEHQIDYLPGSVELGDYDPTSTSIAVVPGGEMERLPAAALRRTYEKYWEEIVARRQGTWHGEAYSPYELRNVGVFVRLGWRHRANALLDYLMDGRRPAAWNEWAEVVWLDRDLPRFIGDMPHTWVGAGYVQAIRSMLAYERESDQALVIAAGVRPEWVSSPTGVGVRRLPTHWGVLNYSLRATGPDTVRLRLSGDLTVPPGRIVLPSPYERPLVSASVDGRPATIVDGAVVVDTCPADVVLRYQPAEP